MHLHSKFWAEGLKCVKIGCILFGLAIWGLGLGGVGVTSWDLGPGGCWGFDDVYGLQSYAGIPRKQTVWV